MSIKHLLFALFFTFSSFNLSGQTAADSVAVQKTKGTEYILPSMLLFSGLALNNSAFELNLKNNIREQTGPNYSFAIDDFAQYAPIAILGIANISHVEARNHWFDQAKYLFISNLLVSGITHGLKRAIDKERPNGERFAFPSGHTSFAFTNAMVLYKEYEGSAPLVAYSGFGFAGTTAAFRMINNKHWISDVLAGAGIAILVTELVYHFEPLKNFNPFIGQKKMSILPNFGGGTSLGLTMMVSL